MCIINILNSNYNECPYFMIFLLLARNRSVLIETLASPSFPQFTRDKFPCFKVTAYPLSWIDSDFRF